MKNFYYFFALFTAVFSSQLNAQWVRTEGPTGRVYSLAASDGNIFAGNNNGNIFRSTDYGLSWTIVYTGPTGNRTDAIAISDTNIFATQDVGIVRSTNNGTGWYASGLNNLSPQALAVYHDGTGGTNLFAGTYVSGVYRSTDNGANWSAVNNGLTGSSQFITALFACDTFIFAGTWGGSAFRSTNKGTTWTSVKNGLTSNNVHAFTLSANPAGGVNLFAGTYFGSGIYLSTDYGLTWTAAGAGLTRNDVRALAGSGANLYAGTDKGGVCISTNNGISWLAFNTGLTDSVVNCLTISGTNLFAGTNDGVWKRSLSDIVTTSDDQFNSSPMQFVLGQNYPNPFNPVTTITYSIASPRFISLNVYDVMGRQVAELVSAEKQAGSYEIKFNAEGLSSGVYFYTLKAGSNIETKKLILLR